MRSIVFGGAFSALASAVGLCETPTAAAVIDLGDIPQRPTAPEFPFERFFETRKLGQVEFAPDNRAIYALRNDGRVTNVFAMDLTTKAAYPVTHFEEPVTEFFADLKGRYLITVRDIEGNEAFDLYHYDLASGAVHRPTETGKADRTTVCGLWPVPPTGPLCITRRRETLGVRRTSGAWRPQAVRLPGCYVAKDVYWSAKR
jgi:hypothetical protein